MAGSRDEIGRDPLDRNWLNTQGDRMERPATRCVSRVFLFLGILLPPSLAVCDT